MKCLSRLYFPHAHLRTPALYIVQVPNPGGDLHARITLVLFITALIAADKPARPHPITRTSVFSIRNQPKTINILEFT